MARKRKNNRARTRGAKGAGQLGRKEELEEEKIIL